MRDTVPGKKRTGLLAAVIILLLLVIIVLSLQITEIKVTGNKQYTEEQIVELLFPDGVSRNTGFCYRELLPNHD